MKVADLEGDEFDYGIAVSCGLFDEVWLTECGCQVKKVLGDCGDVCFYSVGFYSPSHVLDRKEQIELAEDFEIEALPAVVPCQMAEHEEGRRCEFSHTHHTR